MSEHDFYHAVGYQAPNDGSKEQSYFPPQGQTTDGQIGGLASRLGNVGIGADTYAAARPNKKKHRHAHHLDQAAGPQLSSSPFPQGMSNSFEGREQPAGPHFNSSPYGPNVFNPIPASHELSPGYNGHPYAGQQITPTMNQFPAQSGSQFSPGIQALSPGIGGPSDTITTPSGTRVPAQGNVNPEQIPSIPKARDLAAEYYLDHIYPTMEQHLPPQGAIAYVTHDQGNTSPKYARLTINSIPSTSEALSSTALPLGLVLQPLAPLQEGEQAIPVLDFGEAGPPRCRRCRTYINPFMTFRLGGDKLVCNMCTFPNDVAPEYFAPTDPSGVRVDRAQRPELITGTVEYLVPKEYWAKEPVGLRWLFLIDVGQEAVNKGFLEAFCEGILGALYGNGEDDLNGGETDVPGPRSIPLGSKVGFVSFDKQMHFYNCSVCLPKTLDIISI